MPLDLRDHPTRPAPALRLVSEARIEAPHVVRGATHRPREERRDLRLEHLVGGQADRVLEALRLQVLVYVREREGRITAQEASEGLATIPRDHRVEYLVPTVRAGDVARSERAPFQVAVLIEHEQRVIAGAREVAVVRRVLLRAVGRAHAAVDVEHHRCSRPSWLDAVDPGCDYVFHRNGRRLDRFDDEWCAAAAAVGLASLKFHDLRRSAARNFRRAGTPESVVMALGGWKTRSMFLRYDITDERDLAHAAGAYDAFLDDTLAATPTVLPVSAPKRHG